MVQSFPSVLIVEACVTTLEEAVGARDAGAHRLELCVELHTGGLTPPPALVEAVKAAVDIPVFCMARPRAGSFVMGAEADGGGPGRDEDVAALVADVARVRDAGADGVVMGALLSDGTVDREATAAAVQAAGSLPLTFHRAFDEAADLFAALEALAEVGAVRVLTGGGPGAAREHADTLADLVRLGGAVEILAGGRIRGDHVHHLVAYTGLREVHARAEGIPGVMRALDGI